MSARTSAAARKLVTTVYTEVLSVKIYDLKFKNLFIISTFLFLSIDKKYLKGAVWRIVARLRGDRMKGEGGKIRIMVGCMWCIDVTIK